MTHHIGYIHGSRLAPFSPPSFCTTSGARLEEYRYYYQKGYRLVTGQEYIEKQQQKAA